MLPTTLHQQIRQLTRQFRPARNVRQRNGPSFTHRQLPAMLCPELGTFPLCEGFQGSGSAVLSFSSVASQRRRFSMFLKPRRITLRRLSALATLSFVLTAGSARADFLTFFAGGTSATSSIQSTVDSFRVALGGSNNGNNPGPLASGRREINWDGGGATTATVSGPMLTAFTNTRGSTFSTAGTGFLQTPVNDPALTSFNPGYASTFSAFSPQRIFTPVTSNTTDVTFSVPGTMGATAATVAGFGAVFSDVDLPNVTRLEFFGSSGDQILSLNALPGTTDGSFSFLGAVANAGEKIARVRITAGNSDLGPSEAVGSRVDVVVMDDFIYSEPNAVPEPTSLVLVGVLALSAVGGCGIRRRRGSRLSAERLQVSVKTPAANSCRFRWSPEFIACRCGGAGGDTQ
jgi:hypothetical protein